TRTYNIITATGGVTGQFATVDINLNYLTPTLAYAANDVTMTLARRTQDIQREIVSETSDQQTSVAARKTAQTIDARIDDAVTASLINLDAVTTPSGNGGERNNQGGQANAGGVVSKSAGDDMAGWGVWATVTPTFLDQSLVLPNRATPQKVDGTVWDLFVGADKVIGSKAVAGMFAGYEDSNFDLDASGGERSATGPMIGAYTGVVFTNWLYASAQANHVWFDNELSEASFGGQPVRGEFDSRRYAVSTGLTAHRVNRNNVRVQGKISYSYTKEKFSAYRASDGANVAAFKSRLGRLTLSTEMAYLNETFTPYFTAAFERDVQAPSGGGDELGGVLGLGGRYLSGALSIDFYGNFEVGRAAEKAATLGLNARFAF
ncbi:MAG: autotransporter outer membrane beta-barrel domain-containing protein, partial [Rhodospirillaceae bacterium]|nr:autotransporter outer membrane beta-barrel domain-containing protein [Rhodospirillaceae bacterium]